jgi:hypothetical protein
MDPKANAITLRFRDLDTAGAVAELTERSRESAVLAARRLSAETPSKRKDNKETGSTHSP